MVVPVAFARPFHIVGLPFAIFLAIFALLIVRLDGSFEAASVWCWSALALILYFLLYPFAIAAFARRGGSQGEAFEPGSAKRLALLAA